MQSDIFAMIKEKSDNGRMEQSSISLIGHSFIIWRKIVAQGMNDRK